MKGQKLACDHKLKFVEPFNLIFTEH